MKVLLSLTYFTPNKSGLTVFAERQAAALVAQGHEVTVLTSGHLPDLPSQEWLNGVRIIRLPVALRLSKGVLMPSLIWKAWHLVRQADVINLHMPQLEGAYLALLAKLLGKPLIATHHSDLAMPSGWLNKLAGAFARLSNRFIASLAHRVTHNTLDFAQHSPFLQRYLHKLAVIPPICLVEPITDQHLAQFQEKHNIQTGQIVIGIAARLASEKGFEFLAQAFSEVLKTHPTARVLVTGEYQHVIGEEAYRDQILRMVEPFGDRWQFLGVDSQADRAAFFRTIHVHVLPSINATETFGMVQVEALTCGTPLIASNLPGMRQPVMQSGCGILVPPRDSHALAAAILHVLQKYPNKVDASAYTSQFTPEKVAQAYEDLYKDLIHARRA